MLNISSKFADLFGFSILFMDYSVFFEILPFPLFQPVVSGPPSALSGHADGLLAAVPASLTPPDVGDNVSFDSLIKEVCTCTYLSVSP